MIVTHWKSDEAEIKRTELNEQVVAMMLKPSAFDFGFQTTSVVRLSYDTHNMFLPPRYTPMWVRCIGASFITANISDSAFIAAGERSTPVQLHCTTHLNDRRISALMMAVNADREAGFPSGRLFLDSIELAIATALVQRHAVRHRRRRKVQSGLTPAKLKRVVDLVQTNLHEDLSLQELADVAGLSIWHFSQMFRKTTGTTPHQFLLRQRLERATIMLQNPNAKVLVVALACGFRTQQHFARSFRNIFGVSPTEYRRFRE
jgi:AraC family transcriptional regulator